MRLINFLTLYYFAEPTSRNCAGTVPDFGSSLAELLQVWIKFEINFYWLTQDKDAFKQCTNHYGIKPCVQERFLIPKFFFNLANRDFAR